MVSVTHPAVTGYRIKMQKCIIEWKGAGQVSITQEELAACMQVRVTQSFRRHISEMQSDGVVQRFTYQTTQGGYKVAYLIH